MDTIEPQQSGPAGPNTETIEVMVIEIVELEEHAKHHGTHAPHARHYAFRVDKQRIVVDVPKIDGEQILAKVGKTPEKTAQPYTAGFGRANRHSCCSVAAL